MITAVPIRLESAAPRVLLLDDAAERAILTLRSREEVEALLGALFNAAEELWPAGAATPEPPVRPARTWGCRLGDDCTCLDRGIEPGGCGHYQGTWSR